MPRLIFGTWGTDATVAGSVITALERFEGLETTGEFIVGKTLSFMFNANYNRSLVFIQTKVDTYYAAELSPAAPVSEQVLKAVKTTLNNLNLTYVDSLLLESHYSEPEQMIEAWRGMEEAVNRGWALQVGLANVNFDQLVTVDTAATVKPAVVQKPWVADFFVEHDMREWCIESGVAFQTWAVLGRDEQVMKALKPLAQKYNTTSPALFLRFALGCGLLAITPSWQPEEMEEDLLAFEPTFSLKEEDSEEVLELLGTMNLE
eukprot:gnl/TRDRNA2_/TRDRNA2_135270_c0_seq1.p1 gnl/TRDRNA2_/TRDRNA2_135270_c0~~gnl/TRDRNA2_/TRDRNA2_135270_c0_seq1.p1  ORF type:complete len:261 (-),score=49.39 gnl/TRDRNA2_/TRDRNA2_135270_c0_seq1:122-904(-)